MRKSGRVRRMFRWAVSEELCPSDVLQALVAVAGLRKGRTAAPDAPSVRPVAESVVNATLPHLPRVIRDMVRLQLLSGCRPGEIISLKPSDVCRDGEVGEYAPASHKTEHHGQVAPHLFRPAGTGDPFRLFGQPPGRLPVLLSRRSGSRTARRTTRGPKDSDLVRQSTRHE